MSISITSSILPPPVRGKGPARQRKGHAAASKFPGKTGCRLRPALPPAHRHYPLRSHFVQKGRGELSGHAAQLCGRVKPHRPAVCLTKGQQARFILLQVDACGGGDCLRSKAVSGAEGGKGSLQRVGACAPLAADAQHPMRGTRCSACPVGQRVSAKSAFSGVSAGNNPAGTVPVTGKSVR